MVEQSFESSADEYIFGLGQFQDGQYNLKNVARRLTQVNTQIAIPFIFSSKGYGLLWHQYGLTDDLKGGPLYIKHPKTIDRQEKQNNYYDIL
jgi:alpha-glucosidase (family GH31 glycosyl hydrolase)